MSAKFIFSSYKNRYYLCLDKRMEGPHVRHGPNWLTGRNQTDWIYLRPENKDRRTNWIDRQTDKLDWPTRRKDNLTNGLTKLTNWKEGTCGWPNRLDGWTDEPKRRTNQMDQTDGSNGLDGRTDAPNQWIRRTDTQTHGADVWTVELDKRTRRTDGLTNWTKLNNSWIRLLYDRNYHADLGGSDYSHSHSVIANWLLLQ